MTCVEFVCWGCCSAVAHEGERLPTRCPEHNCPRLAPQECCEAGTGFAYGRHPNVDAISRQHYIDRERRA
jgi:hypothetical protein